MVLGIIIDLLPITMQNGTDKIYHFVGFAVFTGIAIANYVNFFGYKHINNFLVAMLILGGFCSALSEFFQKLVAVRSCDVTDWFVDLLGILIVCTFAFLYYSKRATALKEFEEEQILFGFDTKNTFSFP